MKISRLRREFTVGSAPPRSAETIEEKNMFAHPAVEGKIRRLG